MGSKSDYLHPRSLDSIAREIRWRWVRPTDAGEAARQDLLRRPVISEALYPRLAVRAVRVFLESASTWHGKHAVRIKAELLDQVEDWERYQAELNREEESCL